MQGLKMMKSNLKRYSELIQLPTFQERFRYLELKGKVAEDTFGSHRYLNQALYRSREWKNLKRQIILRDNGCDLGVEGFEINESFIVHHINPITLEQIQRRDPLIFDPENLITTRLITHNAIHYGDESILCMGPVERHANDTCPWR